VSLEPAYKHLPAECVIWRAGKGKTQPVTLLPKGRFRNIINSCWRESPQKRPTFTQILVTLEETVSLTIMINNHVLSGMCVKLMISQDRRNFFGRVSIVPEIA
jgi:hypothetical protein